MNKKFLSAILFGTLMVGTAGTFTSCKDYDEDIDRIDTELSGIKSQLEALEGKIKDGKWITSVTPTANGLTITLSDGQTYEITNGKNGQDGAAGAAGTEWTISEDGYWVCNGEKTDVKAVGQDGEKGEPGQQEVKFENGKWFLWNGTEFVEFKGAATTDNVPYYYTDPNDQNYTILVVFDKDGQNKKEIRLPMNEGLAQITLLDAANYEAKGANIEVSYALRKASTKWDGARELPAIGEYMVGVNENSILVQVTPANYDLAALDLKFVNGKGEEVPVTVGKATPVTLTRAISATGVYKIPVSVNPIEGNAELVDFYATSQPISLMANESVRSTYSSTLKMAEAVAVSNPFTDAVDVKTAEPFVVISTESAQIYDSYLKIKDTQTNNAIAIKHGITVDGMTVNSKESAAGKTITLVAHYVTVNGAVNKQDIDVTFAAAETPEPETINLPISEHTIAFIEVDKTPSLVASFDEYFKNIQGNDRIVWNSEHTIDVSNKSVSYTYTDPETYETKEGVLDYFVKTVAANEQDATLNTEDGLAKFRSLKIALDYSKAGEVLNHEDAVYTLQVVVENTVTGAKELVNVPFTVAQPSAAEIAKQFAFDGVAYNKETNAFTVFGTTVNLNTLIAASADGIKNGVSVVVEGADKADKNNANYTVVDGVVTMLNDKYNTAFPITSVYVEYAGHNFAVPAFNVIFKKSEGVTYNFSLSNAVSVVRGGSAVSVKNGDLTTADKTKFAAGLNILDPAGNKLKSVVLNDVILESAAAAYVTAEVVEGNIVITPIDEPIAKDTTFKATIKFTYDGGSEVKETEAAVLVTVKAI